MNYNGKKIALFRSPSRSIESESVLSFDDLEEDEKDNVKRKTRNLSEKKRRDQFNVLINELCSMVAANSKKMDKSTVLKSAIQFLRNHQEFSVQSAANEIKEDWKPTFLCNEEFAQLMLEAVESFLVVFTHQGKVLFTSDSITSLLGHVPADLINHSLYDLMHEDDRLKFFNLLAKHQNRGILEDDSIVFTCHLRRGAIDPKESPTYEYVRVTGTSQIVGDVDGESSIADNDFLGLELPEHNVCFCCTVRLQTSHIIREMSTVDENTSEFTSRHSLEWKFLFLDHRAPPIIGYLPFEVLGTSGYDYYHPDDLESVSKCHEQLMQMGKGTSSFYRFLTKGQQWIWLQTRYYITYHQWNSKPEFIVCTNSVVSYHDVRKKVREELGYLTENTSKQSDTAAAAKSGSGVVDLVDSKEGLITSFANSSSKGLSAENVQSPNVASSHHSENERAQVPHSTKQERSTRKHVSSQLQSLLQLHLQRTSSNNTPRSNADSTGSATMRVALAAPALLPVHSQIPPSGKQAQNELVPISSSTVLTSMAPPQNPSSGMEPPSSSQSVVTSQCNSNSQSSFQSGLLLSPAQQLLHDQLVHKSEQLQKAIQQQQEELRLIREQLAVARSGVSQTEIQASNPQPQIQTFPQQQFASQDKRHLLLQHRLSVTPQPMILAPGAHAGHQLPVVNSHQSPIFLSPIANVNTNIQSRTQQQSAIRAQLQTQLRQQQQPHAYQTSPLVLQPDGSNNMVLAPPSPSITQLAMMAPNSSPIFLSPLTMDVTQASPANQTSSPRTPQHTQTISFVATSGSNPNQNSNNMDLSDSC